MSMFVTAGSVLSIFEFTCPKAKREENKKNASKYLDIIGKNNKQILAAPYFQFY